MAVVFEGFSIREYASKMRSVNVSKCWPFEKEEKKEINKDEEIESNLLPPMRCKKYRWWSSELEAVKSSVIGEEEDDEGRAKILEVTKPLTEVESGFEFGNVGIEKEKVDLGAEKAVLEDEEEKLMMICPVCKIFTAATVNAVNVHIDSCLAQASKEERKLRKAAKKSKTLKKRSIVDIFAVAPQIEAVDVEDDDEEDKPDIDEGIGVESKEKIKSKFKGAAIARNLKLKNKKKWKKSKINGSAKVNLKKENSQKLNVPVPASFSVTRTKHLLLNRMLQREMKDDVAIWKKKSSSKKRLVKQNKLNVIKTSKLIAKHQQQEPPVFPVHSILKNQSIIISSQKPSDCLKGDDQTKLRPLQQSERHVSFSGKDDILGPTKKCCSSLELPQSQCFHKIFSDVVDNASVTHLSGDSHEDFPTDETPEVNGSEGDIVINITSEAGVGSTHENKWLDDENDHVSVSSFVSANNNSCRDKGKGSSDESVDLTRVSRHHHDFQLFSLGNSNPYAGIPRDSNSTEEGLNSNVEIQACGYQQANDTGRSLSDPFIVSVPRSAAKSSQQNIWETSQPSASGLTTSTKPNVRHQFLQQSTTGPSNVCSLEFQPSCHLSPKGLMSSISSSVNWKKQGTSMCRNKSIDDDFIGLPLNSQGELIQFYSSGKLGYNSMKKQDVIIGSSSSSPIHNHMWPNSSMDQTNVIQKHLVESTTPMVNLKQFPGNNCLAENPRPLPSRLGITEMQGSTRSDVHWHDLLRGNNESVHRLGSDLNLMNVSCRGCRQCSLNLNQTGNEKKPEDGSDGGFLAPNQLTMRLMGKDVTVGRSSNQQVQGSEDGERIWTDKEIITEHYPTMTASASANSSLCTYSQPEWVAHPLPRKAKGSLTHPFEAQTTHNPPNFWQMRVVDPRSAHSYLDWQKHLVSQTGILSVNRNNCPELQPFADPLASQLWMNRTSKVSESFISQNDSLKMGSKIPVPAPSPHNACDHMLFSSAHLKSKKNLDAQETASSLLSPFSSQDCAEYVQPSWSQSSSYSLPPWLLSATTQKESPPTISQPYSDTIAKYQPCSVSGAGFVAIPSPYHSSMVSYPHNPKTSLPRVRSSSGPSSLVHPPLIPVPPGFKRTFPMTMSSLSYKKRLKVKDGTKSNHFDHGKKARKRPAAKADDSARSTKKNCEMHYSGSLMGLNSVYFNDYMQCNTGTLEVDASTNKGSEVGFSSMELQRDGLRSAHGINFPQVEVVGRSGPIKLSAGAKHILKPNQSIDQDDYRPTHSTIPVGVVTNSSKASVLQKKPARIYRF